MPWWGWLIMALAPKVVDAVTGANQGTQQTTQKSYTQPRGFQDPMLGLLSQFMSSQLMGGWPGMSGAGMPGGKGYTSPFGGDILSMMLQNWPDLLKGYGRPLPGNIRKKEETSSLGSV